MNRSFQPRFLFENKSLRKMLKTFAPNNVMTASFRSAAWAWSLWSEAENIRGI